MSDLVLETPLTPEEIQENFKDFDLFSNLKQGLEDALAYQRGEEVPGLVVHERSLPDVDAPLGQLLGVLPDGGGMGKRPEQSVPHRAKTDVSHSGGPLAGGEAPITKRLGRV